jgi:hypothetical protein
MFRTWGLRTIGMHALTVEKLIEKGKLEPEVSVGIAEAIDIAMTHAQLVTVPVLDARFAEFERRVDARFAALEKRIEEVRAELVRWVFLVMLGNVAINAGVMAVMNALQHR